MADNDVAALSSLVTKHETTLLSGWMRSQIDAGSLRSGQIKEDELANLVTAVPERVRQGTQIRSGG